MDTISATPDGGFSSPAARRNAAPILDVLRAHMPARGRVLEIASGSGEHAVAFAVALPGLEWTPSDPSPEARDSIGVWARQAGSANLRPPLALDVLDEATWPGETVEAVICINMIHISPWAATKGLMRLAGTRLRRPGALLVLYGPFLEAEVETAPSNLTFDDSLKTRDSAWGLRDRDSVIAAAAQQGLAFTLRKAMPANNLMLLFRAV